MLAGSPDGCTGVGTDPLAMLGVVVVGAPVTTGVGVCGCGTHPASVTISRTADAAATAPRASKRADARVVTG
jgi:hypothetical protein